MKKEVSKGRKILSTVLCIVVIFITFIFVVAVFSDDSGSVNNSPSTLGYEDNTTLQETISQSKTDIAFSIDCVEQSNDKWKMTYIINPIIFIAYIEITTIAFYHINFIKL